ncbi:MAG: acyl-CoA carboxylase biotin carboxyl carrier protein subunit [Planctomycetota bacterium]
MSRVHLQPDGASEHREVLLEQVSAQHDRDFICHIDGQSHQVQIDVDGMGRGHLHMEGRGLPWYANSTKNGVEIWIDGRVYKFLLVDQTAQRAATGGAAGGAHDQVVAPMPGTVLRVEVAEGESFAAHQPLVIMESMKMETTLSVPHAGVVSRVLCEPGTLVEMGAVLVKVGGEATEPQSDGET